MDFCDYDLTFLKATPSRIYQLGGGVLIEMADRFAYELNAEPTEQTLFGLVGAVGPHKELQRNIEHAQEVLGSDAVDVCADWLERSGVMNAVAGAFSAPATTAVPSTIDAVVWSGGVANWQLRRRNLTERLDPTTVGRVVLPMGSRLMGAGEHPLVATYTSRRERQPTEYQFCCNFVKPVLQQAGFRSVEVISADSGNGDAVCEFVFRHFPELLDGIVLTIGNAPNTIQGAGQLRDAARRVEGFDENGDQLFMMGDFFPVARHGEDKSTHQNPLSGIGQIARNAAFLLKAIAA
jgi:hypothetical protein